MKQELRTGRLHPGNIKRFERNGNTIMLFSPERNYQPSDKDNDSGFMVLTGNNAKPISIIVYGGNEPKDGNVERITTVEVIVDTIGYLVKYGK